MTKAHKSWFENLLKSIWSKFRKNENDNNSLRETIEELIEESQETESSIESDEREILGNILNLRDLTAYDVMLPRADIIAAPITINEQEMIQRFVKTGVMGIIIYRDNLDDVVGVLHIKDVLAWNNSKKSWVIKNLLREVLFISPTMRILDLLLKMRETGSKIAIVVDEYGGVDGVVTFSNLIEEIIGDIQDAHGQSSSVQIKTKPDGTIVADARIKLAEVNGILETDLLPTDEEDDIDTLGGLIVLLAGRVPVKGEVIRHPDGKIEFEILEADPRRVQRVCLRKIS